MPALTVWRLTSLKFSKNDGLKFCYKLWQFWVNFIFWFAWSIMLHLNPNTEKTLFFSGISCDVILSCHLSSTKKFVVEQSMQVTSVPLLRFYRYTFAVQVRESRILIWVSKHFSVNIVVVWGDTGPIVWAPFWRITVCHCKDPKGPDNMMRWVLHCLLENKNVLPP